LSRDDKKGEDNLYHLFDAYKQNIVARNSSLSGSSRNTQPH